MRSADLDSTRSIRRHELAILCALSAVIFFWGLGSRPLYAPDEGRYAEIGREMLESGDWWLPRLSGVPYLDKPPLLPWLEAVGMAVLGINEWGARLLPATVAWLGVLLTYLLGRALYDPRTGLCGAAMLTSSLLYAGIGRVLVTDGLLTVAVLAAFLGFWRGLSGASALWMWFALAVALLAKGPVGLAIFALGAAPFWLGTRPPLRRFAPLRGALILALIAAPWYVRTALEVPGALSYFVLHENLRALVSDGVHHAAPWYAGVGMLAGGFSPWTVLLPGTFWSLWRRAQLEKGIDPPTRLLVCWALGTFLLFTMSASKLMTYFLPMYPALALLVARETRSPSRAAGAVLLAAGLVVPLVGILQLRRWGAVPWFSGLSLALLTLAVGMSLAGALLRRSRSEFAPVVFTGLLAVAVIAASGDLARVDGARSVRGLLLENSDRLVACDPLVSAGFPVGMAEFYGRRPVLHLGVSREFEMTQRLGLLGDRFIPPAGLDRILGEYANPCLLAEDDRERRLLADYPRLRRVAARGRYALLELTPSARLRERAAGKSGEQ